MNYMEEDKAVRNFIIIFIIVILLVVGLYFLTVFINKDNDPKNEETNTSEEVKIDNSKVIVGTMLQKGDKDYYVILYKGDDEKANEYAALESKYKTNKDSLPVYTVDLSDGMNSKYYDKEHVNLTASDINDLKFGDITVLEVKDGKIYKSFNSVDKIKKEWKIS